MRDAVDVEGGQGPHSAVTKNTEDLLRAANRQSTCWQLRLVGIAGPRRQPLPGWVAGSTCRPSTDGRSGHSPDHRSRRFERGQPPRPLSCQASEDGARMSLEIVYGETRKRRLAGLLAKELQDRLVTDGTIYLGYPVLTTADARVDVDALMVTEEHGLVAFLLADDLPTSVEQWDGFVDAQDRLYAVLESQLTRHEELRARRRLAIDVQTVTVFASSTPVPPPADAEGTYVALSDVAAVVEAFPAIGDVHYKSVQAALQRVTTIKPAKRRAGVQKSQSRGAAMKRIEKNIANLDRWQKRAAIESPQGPQRIRGLAGSGKTVVLALKASYLHAQYPEWNIALTFHTRALYQQLEDLVTRFSFEHSNDKPDFSRLQIMHSWGGSGRYGVYHSIARHLAETPRDFNYARATYGAEDAFKGVCAELLRIAESQPQVSPLFDAVLVDEAQDLPTEFFRLIYLFTKEPKRIVWAYDELQKLNEAAMPPLEDLFGRDASGSAVVNLEVSEGQPRRDILLPICYRNTPWAISTAHALGFGIYRDGGLVQHFDEPRQWREIGYEVRQGSLEPGADVSLERGEDTYPDYFPELVTKADAVVLQGFEDELDQDTWVASQILANLRQDELEHDDILIVLPDSYTAKRRATRLSKTLSRAGIDSHLVGVTSSVDEVFVPGSVAIASIYRAKGNEAPMVYVLDAQYAARPHNAITRRNTLFTAITRSRAWVRIYGHGEGMVKVTAEVSAVQAADYALTFRVPTATQLARMRRVNRDRSESEADTVVKATRTLEALLEAFDNGELDIEDLPPRLRTRLVHRVRGDVDDDH